MNASSDRHRGVYEWCKDFATPLLVVFVGTCLTYLSNQQQKHESKDAILREMMTKGNGPDVAFFTAVGQRLTVHLQQYERFDAQAKTKGTEQEAAKKALFDEKAIYFFYGMFRVAVLDFLATKGYVLYPRIWMEEAFRGLRNGVVKEFIGHEERDDDFPEEEAALYRYFGASKATYHAGSKRPNEPIPDLFEFALILGDAPPVETGKGPYYALQVTELREGFQRFQRRLHERKIEPQKIITAFEAMVGLDDYAFNTLFSHWYQQFKPDPPVRIRPDPPEDFLPYPIPDFRPIVPTQENKEWAAEREKAWELIFKNVPPDLRIDAKDECGR
jgi:hypothetical protein